MNKGIFSSALKTILVAALVIALSCALTVGLSVLIAPADTYICGYQVHKLTSDNVLDSADAGEYIDRLCIVKSASASLVVEGDLVAFKANDGTACFACADEITDADNIITVLSDGTELQISCDSVRGVVISTIGGVRREDNA